MDRLLLYILGGCAIGAVELLHLPKVMFAVLMGLATAVCIVKYDDELANIKGCFILFCCGLGLLVAGVVYGVKQGLDVLPMLTFSGIPRNVNRIIYGGYAVISASIFLVAIQLILTSSPPKKKPCESGK